MAGENDPSNQEEYTFDDADLLGTEPDEGAHVDSAPSPATSKPFALEFSPVVRNALIGVGVLIMLIIMVQLIAVMFPAKKPLSMQQITPAAAAFTPPPQAVIAATPAPAPVVNSDPQISAKLSALEQAQSTISASVNNMSNQLTNLNNDLETLSTQMQQLNGTLTVLNNRITQQAEEVHQLHVQRMPAPARKVHKPLAEHTYALQAVIPGRAWLIAQNGSTITVREGTLITGYGVVKKIDAKNGRVTTSSGRVIRFSQADS